jgi:hypothetical protein
MTETIKINREMLKAALTACAGYFPASSFAAIERELFGPPKPREVFIRFVKDGTVESADLSQARYLGPGWFKFREVLDP